jgi:thioredoxin-related protein
MPITSTKARGRASAIILWVLGIAWAQAGDFEDSAIAHVGYPTWFKESFLDLQEDIAEAGADGKLGLMVLFTTEGCSYCAEFIRRSLGDAALASKVRSHFDAIGLEIFSDAEMLDPQGNPMRVKGFAEREGAGFAPTLLFYGSNGDLLYRGVGYHAPERFDLVLDYLIGGHQARMSFRDYALAQTDQRASAPSSYRLRSDPMFSAPPYALDRSRMAAQRPLLVIFEADGCSECNQLHDEVLALPEVRALLEGFEVVRLDAQDAESPVVAPDGSRTNPAAWYAATGFSRLPAMLFFEEGGDQVLGTDALMLRQRMMNSLLYTLERAYEKQWSYQRFARSKALERLQQ